MRQLYQFFEKQKWSPVGTNLSISHIRQLFSLNDNNKINYYAFASHLYTKSIKKGESYNNYKHTYLINIISNKHGKIPIRIGKNVDQINDDMTNVITEVQIYVDYFIKEYYNKGNQELTNKYKYIIMLGLNLDELKEFNKEYGDDIVNEYMNSMGIVLDDDEIEPLFTKEEERILEVNTAREEGIGIGERRGEKRKNLELAKNFKKQGVDVNIISKATGLPLKKIMML